MELRKRGVLTMFGFYLIECDNVFCFAWDLETFIYQITKAIVCSKPNEEYSDCGTACPQNCENYLQNINCIALCVKGCFCKNGYIRHNGNCIKPKNCPVCKENEQFKYCGTACPRTCENKDQKSIICTDQCVLGCACKKGFVLMNGKCVKPEECNCGPYEILKLTCPDNPETCANYLNRMAKCKIQTLGCACQPGYVRECKGGKCIKTRDCKK